MYSQQTSVVSIPGNMHPGIQQMSHEFLLHLTSMNNMETAFNCWSLFSFTQLTLRNVQHGLTVVGEQKLKCSEMLNF